MKLVDVNMFDESLIIERVEKQQLDALILRSRENKSMLTLNVNEMVQRCYFIEKSLSGFDMYVPKDVCDK